MATEVKIWFGKDVKTGNVVKRASLKGICEETGVSYSTAKKRQDREGGVTMWLVGNLALEVWVEGVVR